MSSPVDLRSLHTLGLRSNAEQLLHLHSLADLPDLLSQAQAPLHILGGGSNVVPAEQVAACVLKVELQGRALIGEDEDAWYVAAAAGENWHDFVQWTLAQGWPGLENLSLIPGTVGAAPIQNIGAYGLELKDRLHALTAYCVEEGPEQGSLCVFTPEQCQFGYRDSVFKQAQAGRWLIAEVLFRLPKQWQPLLDYGDLRARVQGQPLSPQAVAAAVIQTRQSKLPDPAQLGNAGSFFHNPQVSAEFAQDLAERFPKLPQFAMADGRVKLAAGWLIEQAGWKGKRLGPVGMYEKQALVLVNHGDASAHDVRALMEAVQADVYQLFGVRLQPEPLWW